MDIKEKALQMHEQWHGKIEIKPRCQVKDAADLTLAYTPGVAEPCLKIAADPALSFVYTRRWNSGRGQRRHGSPGPGGYRPSCGHACDGRKMCSFQKLCRC